MAKRVVGVVVLATLIIGLFGYFLFVMPRPIHGPATPVSSGERMKLKSRAGPPAVQEFPQVVAAIARDRADMRQANESDLIKAISISGRVLDNGTGLGIAEATVQLFEMNRHEQNVRSDDRIEVSIKTDGEGNYRFPGVSAVGDILLIAAADGYCPLRSQLDYIRAGETYDGVDFLLDAEVGRVAGHVLTDTHGPIAGALVEVFTGPSNSKHMTVTDEQGAFSIALTAVGEVALRATKAGYGTQQFPHITVGMEQLELILVASGAIAGRVTDKQRLPKEGLNVIVSPEMPEQFGGAGESVWSNSVKTDENGQYHVKDLSEAYTYMVRIPYTVRELLPENRSLEGLAAYVHSQLQQEREMDKLVLATLPEAAIALREGVRVYAGQVTTIDLVVDTNDTMPALVYGYVTEPKSGLPVSPVRVQAFWSETAAIGTFLAGTTTDVDGFYQLYMPTIIRREKVWISAGYRLDTPVASLEVEPGSSKELNLSVAAPITVPVRCIDEAGNPVGGEEVEVGVGIAMWPVSADGRVTIYGLAPGRTYLVGAQMRGAEGREIHLGVSAPFSGEPGETVPEVTILCRRAFGTIVGQLVMPPEAEEYVRFNRVMTSLTYEESGFRATYAAEINGSYQFTIHEAGYGRCAFEVSILGRDKGLEWWAYIPEVEVVPGQTTDLGTLSLNVSEPWYNQ
jgi:protocatechuate 3,4-dioxygenase beta subunit